MRLLFVVFFAFLPSVALAQTPEDRTAVTAAIDRWDEAWRIKDAALGAQDYAGDADWTNAFGMRRTGRAEIEATLAEVFALPFVVAGDSRTMGHEVRFPAEGVAVVTTRVERRGQQAPTGEALGLRQTSHLRVFEKGDDGWRIVSHLISDARAREAPRH